MGVALALVFASSASAFNARGSVEQVYATGLTPGAQVELLDASDEVVGSRTANSYGGTLFRNVTPGDGYSVVSGGETVGSLTVLTQQSAPPSTAIYDQEIPSDGYGYLTTRDGTKLAYSVHPPTDIANTQHYPSCPNPPDQWPDEFPSECPDPPCPEQDEVSADCPAQGEVVDPPYGAVGDNVPSPTLIEYSGYGYARPDGPQSGIAALANIMGFTVVDVNMRGTGCSGGAFDFFEPLQSLDGYDVIEAVSNQPWVKGGKVGMLGISYGGISQLFTAQTQPPSLAAITPLSVIDQPQTTLYPGGILNTGFAFPWAQERQRESSPADPNDPNNGAQSWAVQRVAEGDTECRDNQVLHPEAVDLIQKVRDNNHYVPEVADPVSPITFVDKINVPTFMACQWTDEQTGGHCPTLAKKILSGPDPDEKWFTYTNGTHVDSLSPEIYNRLYDFLSIYVAEEPPIKNSAQVRASAPVAFQAIFGIDGPCMGENCAPPLDMQLPPDPVQLQPTLDLAKAEFEKQPPVRVLFDNGAGNSNAGWPYPAFERSYENWPVPGAEARSWYFGPGGALGDEPPTAAAADTFTWDPGARPRTSFTGNTGTGGLWAATPDYQWSQDPAGTAVAYATAPLANDATVVGAGRVDAWVRSPTPNVDLQVTISEVRPDGKETFVQNGWVRTIARKLDPAKSTELEPQLSFRQEDFEDMPSDRFEPVTIPLYNQGHAYRTGSRIRVRITAPNGDQPVWAFDETDPAGQQTVEIGYGPNMQSRLMLPLVPGDAAGTGLPPCPGLRGEPCRDYQPFQNTTVPVDTDGDGVTDDVDDCPEEAGTIENNGCPEPAPTDTDGDGVPDPDDLCPQQAGTAENGGCPEASPTPTDDRQGSDATPPATAPQNPVATVKRCKGKRGSKQRKRCKRKRR